MKRARTAEAAVTERKQRRHLDRQSPSSSSSHAGPLPELKLEEAEPTVQLLAERLLKRVNFAEGVTLPIPYNEEDLEPIMKYAAALMLNKAFAGPCSLLKGRVGNAPPPGFNRGIMEFDEEAVRLGRRMLAFSAGIKEWPILIQRFTDCLTSLHPQREAPGKLEIFIREYVLHRCEYKDPFQSAIAFKMAAMAVAFACGPYSLVRVTDPSTWSRPDEQHKFRNEDKWAHPCGDAETNREEIESGDWCEIAGFGGQVIPIKDKGNYIGMMYRDPQGNYHKVPDNWMDLEKDIVSADLSLKQEWPLLDPDYVAKHGPCPPFPRVYNFSFRYGDPE